MGKLAIIALALAACGPSSHGNGTVDGHGSGNGDGSGSQQQGCEGLANCYSVYAHSDDTLYVVDLMAKTLTTVGKFNAPKNDTITDLAVAPDNTIYVISETALYTASATDGHVTQVGTLAACGTKGVALTTLPNGQIWEGDFSGALCQIDITTTPPTVKPPITMGSGMALSGDLVAIGDGTVYGTAYKLSDGSGMGTQASNVLVKIDMSTGAVTQVGATGFPKLFGVSFAQDAVIGFTHDQTGHVVSIDPTTGAASIFATFMDPSSNQPISFAGAGVNSLVVIE
ncbi:MAG TPA: hypothetical protein VLX92_17825 [Kofleriaceae bacterium]|nr:hypothetical protein [Kofleriaceae bacterium]